MHSIVAHLILNFYGKYKSQFLEICIHARNRFETRKWDNDPATTAYRLELYEIFVSDLKSKITEHLNVITVVDWITIKQIYLEYLEDFPLPEHAKTFFNSVARSYFQDNYFERDIYFELDENTQRLVATKKINISNTRMSDNSLLNFMRWNVLYKDWDSDWAVMRKYFFDDKTTNITIECYPELFYRNKKAYLLGRIVETNVPFYIKYNHKEQGVSIEEIAIGENELVKIFEFTRSYFWVYTPDSVALVNFLMLLMPSKPREQLFINLGFIRHGKSIMYHHLIETIQSRNEKLIVAPGVRGLVMQVFTMDNYHMVFKIIKDKSSPPKNVTKALVKDRYQFVAHHDRVGRLADTQEFHNLILDKSLFEVSLLEELLKLSSEEVKIHENKVIIKNLYFERKMIPLDIYIRTHDEILSREAIIDYGNAIKDLAKADIFPGDLLIKNFGVTQNQKVIFYDYDEIVKVTECNFRTFPTFEEDDENDDMDYFSAEPSYHVALEDVFPEEFEKFLIPNGPIKNLFKEHHADLFTAKYWQEMKEKHLKMGEF